MTAGAGGTEASRRDRTVRGPRVARAPLDPGVITRNRP